MPIDPKDPPDILPGEAEALPTWRAAYSDRTCALMASFSQLAYMPFEDQQGPAVKGGAKREVAGGWEALAAHLETGGFALRGGFNKDDSQAFLAVHDQQFAVLAFRGTANFGDWRIDLNAAPIDLPGVNGVQVHRGFFESFEGSRAEIVQAVNAYVPPTLGLYITGHSLGGALAQIASAVLARDNLAACYTYGSPRVGTMGFDRQVKCPHYRVVNDWDLVPGVPPPWFHAYRHSGDPRLLTPRARGQEALRRDRPGWQRAAADLLALPASFGTKGYLGVEDHMIWNYRTQLEAIAEARATVGVVTWPAASQPPLPPRPSPPAQAASPSAPPR